MKNELKNKIYSCDCRTCQALVWLVESCEAQLQFSESRAGRLCEIGAVAASGRLGLPVEEVVTQRREFAKHLGIDLKGATSNSDKPTHIDWAISNSNENPDAKNRVNLGKARALRIDDRYFIGMFFGGVQ
jgi:hypothetical protein